MNSSGNFRKGSELLSIIVPARNHPELTSSCLETTGYALSQLKLSAEFILIDDASNADEHILDVFSKHRAKAMGHQTRIVRSRKHQHYSGVFAAGLSLATRELIFFISNDMFVTPSFLEALIGVSALSRDFGIVRGTSNHTDSHPEHQVVPRTVLKSYPEADAFARSVFGANGLRYTEDLLLSGDAVLVKRALIERVGVLDLRFFGYFGDVDYGMRAHLAGFKMVCAKGAWLYHEGAGHVKREAAKTPGATLDGRHAARMQLVETAYQEFRRKWHIDYPQTYGEVRSLEYFDHARAHAQEVALKYEVPLDFMNDFEVY